MALIKRERACAGAARASGVEGREWAKKGRMAEKSVANKNNLSSFRLFCVCVPAFFC